MAAYISDTTLMVALEVVEEVMDKWITLYGPVERMPEEKRRYVKSLQQAKEEIEHGLAGTTPETVAE